MRCGRHRIHSPVGWAVNRTPCELQSTGIEIHSPVGWAVNRTSDCRLGGKPNFRHRLGGKPNFRHRFARFCNDS